MKATGVAMGVGCALLACATGSRAESPPKATTPGATVASPAASTPPASDEGTRPATRWYGWQVLLCDAATAAQLAVAAAVDTSGVLYVSGGSTYFACPMVVHFLHNQIASVGWSAGARIIIPTIGAGIGHAVAPNDGHSRETYLTVGALIGATVGAAIDVLLIAREEIPLWDREEHARTRPRVVPVLGLGTVGVAGRF